MPKGETFNVQVHGLDVLQAKLDSRRFMGPVRQELIERAADAAHKKAREAAKPHPADKGTLGRAIELHFENKGNTARISPPPQVAGLAFTIEEGRRPGGRPPYRKLKAWMISHNIIPEGKGTSAQVQALRSDIRHHGTKGVHFMQQAAELADHTMKQRIPPTERAIKTKWDGPR